MKRKSRNPEPCFLFLCPSTGSLLTQNNSTDSTVVHFGDVPTGLEEGGFLLQTRSFTVGDGRTTGGLGDSLT